MKYNIFKLSENNFWKDSKPIKLYHISSERINNFQPLSSMYGKKGVFFCPNIKSLINDWMPYAKNKKRKTRTEYQINYELNNKIDSLEKIKNKTDNQIKELENLVQKRKKNHLSINNIDTKSYKTMFLYTCIVDGKDFKNIEKDWNDNVAKNYKEENFGFWGWGEQIFVDEKFLNKMKIIDIKKIQTPDDFGDIRQISKRTVDITNNISDPAYMGFYERNKENREKILKIKKENEEKRKNTDYNQILKNRKLQDKNKNEVD